MSSAIEALLAVTFVAGALICALLLDRERSGRLSAFVGGMGILLILSAAVIPSPAESCDFCPADVLISLLMVIGAALATGAILMSLGGLVMRLRPIESVPAPTREVPRIPNSLGMVVAAVQFLGGFVLLVRATIPEPVLPIAFLALVLLGPLCTKMNRPVDFAAVDARPIWPVIAGSIIALMIALIIVQVRHRHSDIFLPTLLLLLACQSLMSGLVYRLRRHAQSL